MILGFSDASIQVIKRGQGCREQGEHCRRLGTDIAPRVEVLLDNGYVMEMLDQARERGIGPLHLAMVKLEKVWSRPPSSDVSGWLEPLLRWSESSPWLTEPIQRLYPSEPEDGYCLIHGDPTMANLMYRGHELILTDPMPRMDYRSEIPWRREVDLGKLIQSAIGWERHLGCWNSLENVPEVVLDRLSGRDQVLALLWAGIHLARIARRAPGKGRPSTAEWAEKWSRRLVDMFAETI